MKVEEIANLLVSRMKDTDKKTEDFIEFLATTTEQIVNLNLNLAKQGINFVPPVEPKKKVKNTKSIEFVQLQNKYDKLEKEFNKIDKTETDRIIKGYHDWLKSLIDKIEVVKLKKGLGSENKQAILIGNIEKDAIKEYLTIQK